MPSLSKNTTTSKIFFLILKRWEGTITHVHPGGPNARIVISNKSKNYDSELWLRLPKDRQILPDQEGGGKQEKISSTVLQDCKECTDSDEKGSLDCRVWSDCQKGQSTLVKHSVTAWGGMYCSCHNGEGRFGNCLCHTINGELMPKILTKVLLNNLQILMVTAPGKIVSRIALVELNVLLAKNDHVSIPARFLGVKYSWCWNVVDIEDIW